MSCACSFSEDGARDVRDAIMEITTTLRGIEDALWDLTEGKRSVHSSTDQGNAEKTEIEPGAACAGAPSAPDDNREMGTGESVPTSGELRTPSMFEGAERKC